MVTRHRWTKLRLHVYICRSCGTGKVNKEHSGVWTTMYHLPDGSSVVSEHVPRCVIGPRTERALAKYASAISEEA